MESMTYLPTLKCKAFIWLENCKQLKMFSYDTDEEATERIKEAQEVLVTLPDYFRVERVLKDHEDRKVFVM